MVALMPKPKDRRLFARLKIEFSLKAKTDPKGKKIEGSVSDIGASGIGISTQIKFESPQIVELWLEIPDGHEPIHTKGKIVWSKESRPNIWRMGISFEEIDLISLSRIFRVPLQKFYI